MTKFSILGIILIMDDLQNVSDNLEVTLYLIAYCPWHS